MLLLVGVREGLTNLGNAGETMMKIFSSQDKFRTDISVPLIFVLQFSALFLVVRQFENTPKALANVSPGFELARTLGTNPSRKTL